MSDKKTGRYQTKRKDGLVPFRYSDTFKQWRRARLAGERDKADDLALEHGRQFGVTPRPADPELDVVLA